MTTDPTTLPLCKLIAWDGNVRRTGANERLDELIASIAAHGVIQSLTVRKASRGRYAVIAGRRRLMALQALAEAGRIEADAPVPVRLQQEGTAAAEISLAENVVRAPMHPADQFDAFRALIDGGAARADIAARFGVSEPHVAKLLRLGRVAPALLDAYRDGDLSLDQVQAFAVSDDQDAQLRVFAGMGAHGRSPAAIRRALTEGEIPATDRRVRFVTLDAYEAAGGIVRRDLFDQENAGYVTDAALLDRLVMEKLAAQAAALQDEGWKWIEIRPEFGYEDRSAFSRVFPEAVDLPAGEAAELERLSAAYDELADSDEGEDAAIDERLSAIRQRIDELDEKARAFAPEDRATAGAVLTLAWDGTASIERGLVRPADERERPKAAAREKAAGEAGAMPASLIADLTAQKTAALRAELAGNPKIALAAVTHALALRAFYGHGSTPLRISPTHRCVRGAMAEPDSCPALAALKRGEDAWTGRLPEDPADLWTWCLAQKRDAILDLLAFAAAQTIDAASPAVEPLAATLKLDMAHWYTPTAGGFFARITKPAILKAIEEAKGRPAAPAWAKLKRAELAALAEREIAGTGWLPAPLRPVAADDTEDLSPMAA